MEVKVNGNDIGEVLELIKRRLQREGVMGASSGREAFMRNLQLELKMSRDRPGKEKPGTPEVSRAGKELLWLTVKKGI